MKQDNLDAMLKYQQWEIAKGHLRAFVSMQGSYTGFPEKWEALQKLVENFIEEAEYEGLHE